jgi:hypothetical protein
MIVVCPKCSTKLRLKEEIIIAKPNAWLKCPKCFERFHQQSVEFITSTPSQPQWDPDNLPSHRRINKVMGKVLGELDLETYAGRKNSQEEFSSILEVLPAAETKRSRTPVFLTLVGCFISVFLVMMAMVFHKAKAPDPEMIPVASPPRISYNEQQLFEDLASIRRDLTKLRNVNKLVQYSGRESRFIKHYLGVLAPELCQNITSIYLKSNRSSAGFQAETTCANPNEQAGTVQVAWQGSEVTISVLDRPELATITTFN